MPDGIRIVNLDELPRAVRKFFDTLGDEPLVLEQEGRARYVVQPAGALSEQVARKALEQAKGSWQGVPAEISEAIAHGQQP